jgi:hypothetical protein
MPVMYERDKGQLVESSYCQIPWITQPSPGASLRGPVSELGRFYEMLLRGGTSSTGEQLVSTATIQQMTSSVIVSENLIKHSSTQWTLVWVSSAIPTNTVLKPYRTVLDSIAAKARSGTVGRNVRWRFVTLTDNWSSHGPPMDSAAKGSISGAIA